QREELRVRQKTHTSSGRAPSESGIRYYVNQLLQQTSHHRHKKMQRLRELLVENHYDISSPLSEFANELSIATQFTTLVMRPNHTKDIVNNNHLIRANAYLLIMVVVFTLGLVKKLHLVSNVPLSSDELTNIDNFVTSTYNELNNQRSENELNAFVKSDSEKDFTKDMLDTIEVHFDNQSNGIHMGGK